MTDERFQRAELIVGLGIAGNVGLALLKGIVGFMAQSTALLADAAHSASEAIRSSRKSNKMLSISTILLSLVILLLGVEMGFSSAKSLWTGGNQAPEVYALAAVGVALLAKELFFQYTYRLGKRLKDKELIANARGHRSEIYSTLVALIGVTGALLGQYAGLSFLYYLDPLAGLVISILVIRKGYLFVKDALHTPPSEAWQQEDAADFIAAVQAIKGIITVDDLKAREQGHYVIIDIKISVNPRASVWEGHELSKRVKQLLMKRFQHVSDVLVHVAPYDAGFPYKHNVDTEHSEFPSVVH
ncbi:cation transporter [Paenibacillus marchantiophytorum]|uniref:Cation transporter n=1 Tax=Paenibacillus marchantiophytorum TaxID=1619310 RepID=A0ABQ1ETH0_9BACL|nr:cation diffusion facilitator family transporter [Paenibacillus marchantiophytorum]GFZ85877.1 cation transporter [Paenibacillus marchantiophytorum]